MSIFQRLSFALPLSILAASCGPPPEPTPPTTDVAKSSATASTQAAAACDDGKAECDGNPATACETDVRSSAAHCGACGVACASGESCVAGGCKRTQPVDLARGIGCAVVSGRVQCWGDNSTEVLSAGSKAPVPTPVVVPGIEQAISVHVGAYFGCAVTAAGKVSCFRGGASRELSLLSGVVAADVESTTLFVVRKNGELSAVSLGYDNKRMEPTQVPLITDAVGVSAGERHTCVVHKTGEVTCWGDPDLTGAGIDTSKMEWEERSALEDKPVKVQGLSDAVQVSASASHTCALRKKGEVVCWGSNWSGELGDGSNESRTVPVKVQLLDDATLVVAGRGHTCARRVSGKVVCWGENHAGQLGGGSATALGMVEVQGLSDAVGIAAAEEVSCAALASGGVSCWGATSRGRLGDGTTSEFVTPQPVSGLAGITQIGAGSRLSCAVDAKKQLHCWGKPSYYGTSPDERRYEPRAVPAVGEVESLRVQGENVCVVNKAKEAYCLESRHLGKEATPIKLGAVKELTMATSVAPALSPTGQVILWSRDWNKPEEVKKQNVAGLADAVAIATDSSTVCAVRRSGKVGCFGYHYRTFDKKDPVKPAAVVEVPGVSDARAIVVDGGEYCIVRKTGEVACFSSYRIPPAVDPKRPPQTPAPKPQPIEVKPVKGVADAEQIAAGGAARCVIHKGGTVSCWGSNSYGQLGNGSFELKWEPQQVAGLADVARIAVGSGHACALKKSGEVLCWGRNVGDEAGQPAPAYAWAPVPVKLAK